jgi:hypothetical protein
LEQRPQFGCEKFLRLERDDLGLRLLPVAHNLEWIGFQAKTILVFPRIHLNLEFERAAVAGFRRELVGQMYGMRSGLLAALPKPREDVAYLSNRLFDRLWLRLHEIDVFGIPQRLTKKQLVDRRATTECNLAP